MNMQMDFRIEAIPCLLARGDIHLPTPCALSGSLTITIHAARLLERPQF
jgi:hypothetical protein